MKPAAIVDTHTAPDLMLVKSTTVVSQVFQLANVKAMRLSLRNIPAALDDLSK